MIEEPCNNLTARPYRGLSVQAVHVELNEISLRRHLLGREVYRRTEFVLFEAEEKYALVQVAKQSTDPLFSPVVDMRMLARPDQIVFISAPAVDVGNATALAEVAAHHHRSDAVAYVVRGRFEHVNFIWRPFPLTVSVTEVVPPHPSKLLAMARQAAAFDEDLPPMDLQAANVDLHDLVADTDKDVLLLPCRGAGVELSGEVEFLDTRPEERRDWLMVGCERSEQFHEHFYGDVAERVDICPRLRPIVQDANTLTLTKCCLLERGIRTAPGRAVVPWGASLDEVRLALRWLAKLDAPQAPELSDDDAPVLPRAVAAGTGSR